MRSRTWLGRGLLILAAALAVTAVLGPLVLDVIYYRTSPTSLDQIVGVDAASLFLAVPACLVAGVLVLRSHPAGPVLGLAPAVFAAYTSTQLIIGNEYRDLAGNVERFFPLLLGVFVLAGALAVTAWTASSETPLPRTGGDRLAGILLL